MTTGAVSLIETALHADVEVCFSTPRSGGFASRSL